jgi:hypothetical protein
VGKLFKLKDWLTVADAARHLSILFGEDVSEADVLRLAIDGHLSLSVLFVNHARGRCGPVVPIEKAKRREVTLPNDERYVFLEGLLLSDDEVLEYSDQVVPLTGVWDLVMVGAGELDVEHEYQRLTGGPAVELICLDGVIVAAPDGTMCQLQEHFENNEFFDRAKLKKPWDDPGNFYPAGRLPLDSVLVVRTGALQAFQDKVASLEDTPPKTVGQRERSTLLTIIAALASLAKVDVSRPSKAAAAIESETTLLGARVAARTVEEHLKRIPEALERRQSS